MISNSTNGKNTKSRQFIYIPAPWEKISTTIVAVGLVMLVAFLLVRNEPIKDPNLVVLLRLLIALSVSSLGAVIPGFLNVQWKGKGLAIRASGAIALFVLGYFFTPKVFSWVDLEEKKISEKLENLSESIDEQFRLQNLKDDPVCDVFLTFSVSGSIEPNNIGFRIMTERLGTLFFYSQGNELKIQDQNGNSIASTPAIGADIHSGHGFYSIDLKRAREAIPQHRLPHLTLSDLEKASFAFMVKTGTPSSDKFRFGVSIGIVVSGWMVSAGSQMIESIESEKGIRVFKDFKVLPVFSKPFTLRLVSNYDVQATGRDIENNWMTGLWGSLNAVLINIPEIANRVNWTDSPEEIQLLPVSLPLVLAVNQPLTKNGGKLGDVKPLLFRHTANSASIIALVRTESVTGKLWGKESSVPPEELKEIVSLILSLWKHMDELGRSEYTLVPLSRIVVLCPTGNNLWVWIIESERLSIIWNLAWIDFKNGTIQLQTEGNILLNKSTTLWKKFSISL